MDRNGIHVGSNLSAMLQGGEDGEWGWECVAEFRNKGWLLFFQHAGLHLPSEGDIRNKIPGEFFGKLKKTI